jgi:PAS domain S-box-containing protein
MPVPSTGTRVILATAKRLLTRHPLTTPSPSLGPSADACALAAANARLQVILEPPSMASITIDDHGIIQSCNPAVVRIFGYPQAELEGNNTSMLMPDPDRTNHGEYLNNYTSGGPAKIIGIGREVEGLRRDATVFPLALAISKVEGLDKRLFVGVVRDISQRKIAEQALVESEESFRSVVETMGESSPPSSSTTSLRRPPPPTPYASARSGSALSSQAVPSRSSSSAAKARSSTPIRRSMPCWACRF